MKDIDHVVVVFKTINRDAFRDVTIKVKEIYYEIEDKMFESDVVNNSATFNEYDKYHIALYEADQNGFNVYERITINHIRR